MTSWPIVTVADIAARSKNAMATGPFGSSIGSRFFRPFGVPIVRGSNLSTDPEIRFSDADLVFLDAEKAIEFSRSIAKQGDLIFSCWGTINQVGLLDGTSAYREYVISNKQMKLTPDRNIVLPEFLYYLFSGPEMQREILGGAVGTGVPGFNLTRLKSLQLRLPPMDEQRDIAAALSSGDRLVAGLVNLISKKRKVKQGLMQELLTGRTRLHGFRGDWVELRVANASHLKARIGWQGLRTDEYRSSGEYRLVGGTDFRAGRVNWDSTPFVDKWRYDQDTNIQLQEGDILITKDGTIGKVALVENLPGPATLNSGVFVLRPKRNSYDPRFIFAMLRSQYFDKFVAGLSAGSTINHLYQKDLVTLAFRVPSAREEQEAIAQVLLDADDDIAALERRLASARAIKQGMMQELLTGRTRLTEGVAA
ncbi:MAG: restriction endonuclease subunit S [Actinomyces sp.]|jgi:type I restriction enzyme S subunit|nr:restriction endonuclease subunit S [Actinomyces sp.]MCI1788702.1 restriction endonuclease subunit S [Actinomyces sp.]MCI1829251.1 restriction endonuclease subunit S [Actinomyces sp.]